MHRVKHGCYICIPVFHNRLLFGSKMSHADSQLATWYNVLLLSSYPVNRCEIKSIIQIGINNKAVNAINDIVVATIPSPSMKLYSADNIDDV